MAKTVNSVGVTFDDKIFHTEVSNITSLGSRRLSKADEHSLQQIRNRNKHLDTKRKLSLHNNKPRSALKPTRVDRDKSPEHENEMETESVTDHKPTTTSSTTTTTNSIESDEEYNFDSDDDDDVFDNPETYKPIGHTKPILEKDITVKTYRKACRKMCIVPHSAILRSLVETEMRVRYGSLGEMGTKACAIALVYNDRVNEVDLTGNNIGDRGAEYMAELVGYNSYVTSLTLAENAITLKGLEQLCEQVASNRYISYLDISANNFGDSGAIYIGNMLTQNDTLLTLNLSKNALLEKGGIIIGDALNENNSLEILDISWNHMRMKGVIGICAGIKHNAGLKHLLAGWNGFYLQGCTAIADALDSNTSLEVLDLENNRINIDCLNQLIIGLRNNKTLKGLNLNLNPIGTEGAMIIINALESLPQSGLQDINIESQTVYNSFLTKVESLQETRTLNITYGTVIEQASEVTQADDTINDDPLIVLMEYMRQNNMRLLDLFNSLDADGSKSLSREEFRLGLIGVNLPLSSQSLDKLLDELDIDGDGEVDFGELMEGQKEFRRRISRIQANKSNNTDDNKFTRIQKKVKALLKAREAIKAMKKLAAARKELTENLSNSNESLANVTNLLLPSHPSVSRRNSSILFDKLPELKENDGESLPVILPRSNSVVAKSAVMNPLSGNKVRRNTISR